MQSAVANAIRAMDTNGRDGVSGLILEQKVAEALSLNRQPCILRPLKFTMIRELQ